MSTSVLLRSKEWEHQQDIFYLQPINHYELKSLYPKIAEEGYSLDTEECYLVWYYHIPNKYLPTGKMIKCTMEGDILEESDYNHPMLPLIRLTDNDDMGSFRGSGMLQDIKPHQIMINHSTNQLFHDVKRSDKGKWVAPRTSIIAKTLAPDSPALLYTGGVPPRFEKFDGINQYAIQFVELLRTYAEKQVKMHGASQGTPPANVRSGVQFAQLEEAQRKAVTIPIDKFNNATIEMCTMITYLMAANYKETDKRTMAIFGRDKEYLIGFLNLDAIGEDSQVVIKKSELPTGKASAMSFLLDLRQQTNPTVVPDEMFIDLIDSGRFNQYTDFAGATVETTLYQIGQILEGEDAADPQPHEDLVLKWKILVGHMRKRGYLSYSDQAKESLQDMLLAIETMLITNTQTPLVQQQLQGLVGFPVLYADDIHVPQLPPQLPPEAQQELPPEEGLVEELPLEGLPPEAQI